MLVVGHFSRQCTYEIEHEHASNDHQERMSLASINHVLLIIPYAHFRMMPPIGGVKMSPCQSWDFCTQLPVLDVTPNNDDGNMESTAALIRVSTRDLAHLKVVWTPQPE